MGKHSTLKGTKLRQTAVLQQKPELDVHACHQGMEKKQTKKKLAGITVVQVKMAGTMVTAIKKLQPLLNSFVLKYVSSE